MIFFEKDIIAAVATPQGSSAIGVIRLSGEGCITLCEQFFFKRNLTPYTLQDKKTHTIHFGLLVVDGVILDEVLISIFKKPHSYTGEESAEISCHGSPYILQQCLQLFLKSGARSANPGEFTQRAFLNGKMDLSQAEAVADLIASNSAVSHQVAMQQMRGGYSNKIKKLRENLIQFASLIELELDFSEEDVEFANRDELKSLISQILTIIRQLHKSFELGNVIKNGIPVAIVGKPNAGKSTLLNSLLNDEKAIVSDIPGTTRDIIEDEIVIDGILFRFIDTAGLRTTNDIIEKIGVDKAYEVIKKSAIIIYLFDAHELGYGDLKTELELIKKHLQNAQLIVVANKIDVENENELKKEYNGLGEIVYISAKEQKNIDVLRKKLVELFDMRAVQSTETVVTNARHAASLDKAALALERVVSGLENKVPGDLLALDIRYALDELGSITGQVGPEDLLSEIFSRFCIGK